MFPDRIEYNKKINSWWLITKLNSYTGLYHLHFFCCLLTSLALFRIFNKGSKYFGVIRYLLESIERHKKKEGEAQEKVTHKTKTLENESKMI